jgi:spermidine synthase/MFS family permease
MNKTIRLILYTTVFTTGAAVLIMEVAAVRLLSPYYGSSLYVLSSVLTTVLFALSLGYYFGGRLSDRFPSYLPLYTIITLGGLSLLGLVLTALYVLPASAGMFPLVFGPLIFSIFFYFIPAFLLGIDSPYVIKLLSQEVSKDESGEVVGATFFWSTAGSITGSIAAGFFLIPTFGLKETMMGTGIVVTLLGVGGGLLIHFLMNRSSSGSNGFNRQIGSFVCLSLGILVGLVYLLQTHTLHANAVYERDGYYSNILVLDGLFFDKPTRFLKRDTNNSSAIFLESDDLVYPYARFAPLYTHLIPDPEHFLMLGGGAYTIPRYLHLQDPDLTIDIVEIEPSLHQIAIDYFRFPQADTITNHVMDARVFLNATTTQYDYVFVDAFSTGHFIPPHLVTKEFFEELRARLKPDGIVMLNFIGSLSPLNTRTITGSFTKTVLSVFPNTQVYTTRLSTPNQPQNMMFILRNGDAPITFPTDVLIDTYTGRHLMMELEISTTSLTRSEDIVFTDNFAPVETLLLKERLQF